MTSAREIVLDLPAAALRVAGKRWGEEGGLPVLALHGWLDNAATFDRLAPVLLAEHDLDLVAIDMPGHGESDHLPPGFGYHFADQVVLVDEVIERLGWQRCLLLGHSMGAAISTMAAAALSKRLCGSILIENLGALSEAPELTPMRLFTALEQRRAGAVNRVHADLEAAVSARMRSSQIDRDATRALVERAVDAVEGDGVRFRHDPRLRQSSLIRMVETQVEAFLRSMPGPLAIVLASDGWLLEQETTPTRLACFEGRADCEIHRLAGGHHLHIGEAEAVASILSPFISRLTPKLSDCAG